METKRQLPTVQELYKDTDLAIEQNQFNIIVNTNPPGEWIKKHPYGGFLYIPIERVEWLLTRIFLDWHVEIRDTKLIANSVVVTVRLFYTHPITGKETYQDGIGASPLQTEKEAGAIEFNLMKTNAVQLAAPSAESYAVKDAAEKIGRLFGKDINRKDVMNYEFGDRFDKVLENRISDKCKYAFNLIRTSTFDDEQKDSLENELLDIDLDGVEEMIKNLQLNQMSMNEKPGYSQGDIQKQMDKHC